MTTYLDRLKNDKSRRFGFGALVWVLGYSLRGAVNSTRVEASPAVPAEDPDRGAFEPMIKPSTHQQVAIDVHRQDRP